ncbi:MAG: response regulator [Sphingomonas sp.]|nr:response regulator [Sphingomonas sp.]
MIRDFDWGRTPLGPIGQWSSPLRTIVGMLCRAPNPLVLLWGADGIMIYNDAYAVIAGKRHPAMLGSKVREAWPEAADFNDDIMTQGLAGRSLSYRDLAMDIARNGEREEAWFNLDYAPVWGNDNCPAGVIAFVAETTSRIQGNAALRETENALRIANDTLEAQVRARTAELQAKEARLRAVFETSFGFQGLLDLDGRLLDANATSLTAIASALKDVAGRFFWATPWFADTPGMDATIREAVALVARGDVVRQELFINLPIGGWRWFDFVLRPIFSTQGDFIAIVPEAIETSERRVAEEALRQSQKLEAMGQLTGGVAHDFNNLLTPIIGTLDLLSRREIGGEREQRLIGGGLQSAERAKMLVQRLLAFARRQPLQPQPVDVAALIASMRDLIASTSGPRIRIDMDIAARLPAANAEVNQLEMALLNLAVNARDAMPEGGTLTIAAATADVIERAIPGLAAGRYVKITISDTGIGMDEHTRLHAIEPFFSTKGIGKGTGLGLSMVHGLASQLGGALNISSKLGLGTSIELLLPATAASVVPIDQPTDPADMAIGAGTVLLVDDEEPVRQTTAEMLIELGYQVIEAHSGEAAIELIDQHAIDMIVTDHLMGGMTGTALIEHVRQTAPDLPMLVISGYADAAGIAADVPRLTKPFRSAELAAMLAMIQQR